MRAVEPPNKGHVGDNINSAVLSFIERLSSFRGSKCTKTIGNVIVVTSNSVPVCREVYYTVSLFRRFHCTPPLISEESTTGHNYGSSR